MGERSDEVNRYDLRDDSELSQSRASAGMDTTDDTADIRSGIEQTRSEMSETIEAIQERLNPQHIKEQVKDQVREQFEDAKATVREATIGKAEDMVRNAGDTINEARYGLMETIRQNPIPAALVGIGLGWMFMNRRSGASYRYSGYGRPSSYYRGDQRYYTGQRDYTGASNYYAGRRYDYDDFVDQGQRGARGTFERVQETAGNVVDRAQEKVGNMVDRTQQTVGSAMHQAQEAVGNVANQAQETAGNIASQTQETASYLADQAQYQAQRLEDRFQQALYENPLAVGAVALALGTAVGFSLPQTQRENEWMGEARDNLVDRAQEVAQNTLERVQEVASDVVDQAQTTVQEQVKERGSASS